MTEPTVTTEPAAGCPSPIQTQDDLLTTALTTTQPVPLPDMVRALTGQILDVLFPAVDKRETDLPMVATDLAHVDAETAVCTHGGVIHVGDSETTAIQQLRAILACFEAHWLPQADWGAHERILLEPRAA